MYVYAHRNSTYVCFVKGALLVFAEGPKLLDPDLTTGIARG